MAAVFQNSEGWWAILYLPNESGQPFGPFKTKNRTIIKIERTHAWLTKSRGATQKDGEG